MNIFFGLDSRVNVNKPYMTIDISIDHESADYFLHFSYYLYSLTFLPIEIVQKILYSVELIMKFGLCIGGN